MRQTCLEKSCSRYRRITARMSHMCLAFFCAFFHMMVLFGFRAEAARNVAQG